SSPVSTCRVPRPQIARQRSTVRLPRLRLQAPRELHRLVREGRRKGHREPACFVKKRRKPKRTYVWGHSGGGMVTGRVLRGRSRCPVLFPCPRSVSFRDRGEFA